LCDNAGVQETSEHELMLQEISRCHTGGRVKVTGIDKCGDATILPTGTRHMAIERPIYPFSALVGQDRLKRALILNAINPRIGGVLIRGEKGTAKSTAVRGLARLLPRIAVVADCPYSCPPDRPSSMCAGCAERLRRG